MSQKNNSQFCEFLLTFYFTFAIILDGRLLYLYLHLTRKEVIMETLDKFVNFRSRTHFLLMYPDCYEHANALEIIKQSYDYAYVLHDRDIDENGKIKKAHWHVVIRTKNQTWASALADDLGITPNYIRQPRSLDNCLAYLMHYHDPDKAQYSLDEVHGNMVTRLSEYLASQNKSEGEIICELLNTIKDWEGYINVTDFAYWCASNGYWAEYRRAGAIINECIKEHNHGKWCELTSPNF